MSGRTEMDARKEKWIEDKLSVCNQILKDYMLSISETKTSTTRKAYLGYLMQFFEYLKENKIEYDKVKPMHIDRYRSMILGSKEERNGPDIVNAKLCAVISFYNFLKDNGIVDHNPCDKKKKLKKKEKEEVTYMSDDEVKELKKKIMNGSNRKSKKYCNRDLSIVTLGCSTGLRVSAIVNIDVDDIDLNKKEIKVVEKGNVHRTVMIGDNTAKVIRAWMTDREQLNINNESALFISQKHGRMSARAVEEMIKKETSWMSKRITPHKMRSTCGMRLYEKKHDIYLVQQQLGHKNIKNTQIYAKASKAMMREAADLLD